MIQERLFFVLLGVFHCNFFLLILQHSKSSQWCQEHFLNYKGLVRASVVREQLKKLLVRFKVPKKSSEGESLLFFLKNKTNKQKKTTTCPIRFEDSFQIVSLPFTFLVTFFSLWPKNNIN